MAPSEQNDKTALKIVMILIIVGGTGLGIWYYLTYIKPEAEALAEKLAEEAARQQEEAEKAKQSEEKKLASQKAQEDALKQSIVKEGVVVQCKGGANNGRVAKYEGGKLRWFANEMVLNSHGRPTGTPINCDAFEWGAVMPLRDGTTVRCTSGTHQNVIAKVIDGQMRGFLGMESYNYHGKPTTVDHPQCDGETWGPGVLYPDGQTLNCTTGSHKGAIGTVQNGKIRGYPSMALYKKHGSPSYWQTSECDQLPWGDNMT
jgi:hypothetical protein